jgi:serine protease Do
MGVSFAIPINAAIDVANQLREKGHVTRGRLGVGIQEVTEQLAPSFKLKEPRGALVTAVEPDSPAAKAGLQAGDVIVAFGGEAIDEVGDLPRRVAQTEPGKQVTIEVLRNGEKKTLPVTVGEMPSQEARSRPTRGSGGGSSAGKLGISVSELPPPARRQLGVDYGLVVEGVQSSAGASPLQPGDVIVAVNNERFKSLDEFQRLVGGAEPGSTVALLVRRGDATLYVPVPVGKG